MNTRAEVEAGWWWRTETDVSIYDGARPRPKAGSDGTYWQMVERATLSYELIRRAQPKKNLPAYPNLTGDEKGLVNTALGVPDVLITAKGCTPPRERPGDTWSEKLPYHWNLTASDNALKETFAQLIAEQRAKYGLPKPKGMAGRKTRPAAWSWLEIWDRVNHGHVANESERHMLHDAKGAARAALKKLKQRMASGDSLPLFRNLPSLLLLNSKRVSRR